MSRFFFGFLLLVANVVPPVAGEKTIVQEFSGNGSTTTGFFRVQDRWEVRWNARQVVSVAVMSSDGTIVAGAAGVLRGSLFVPLRGQYYLKVGDGTVTPPPEPHPASGVGTNTPAAIASTAGPAKSWHLQVVQLGKSVAADQALTVYTPYFMLPDSAITPGFVPSPPPPPVLTSEQLRAMVTIRGDNAQGVGFLMRSPEGIFVVTHLQLLAANPHVQIFTNSGTPITTLSLKGATDRDLGLFTVQDDHLSFLPVPADPDKSVEAGDQVIIPDIGEQTDVLAGKPGRVIGLGPVRIDFNSALGRGAGGAPVIHVKSGQVLAVVTAVKEVDLSDDIAKAWPSNPAPGSAGIIPYFGLRLNGVQGWETYDQGRFLAETLFLHQFHLDTRCLDSFLNGRRRRGRNEGEENGPPDSRYFLNNAKLSGASDTYKQQASGAARDQQLDAAKELLFDLNGFADTGMETLQGANQFYSFDQLWAREEMAYRLALKKELDELSGNMTRFDAIARSR